MLASRNFLTSFAMGLAVLSVGCGGGSSSKSGSTAAALSSASALPEARAAHSAVLLQSGEVLVVGGLDAQGNPLRSTVLVGLTSVRNGPDLLEARVGQTATLLNTGEVLIAGGSDDAQGLSRLDTSELFDPVTETISAGPVLGEARARHASIAVVTSQGERVLVAGGAIASQNAQGQVVLTPVGSAELIDVKGGSSTPVGNLTAARYDAAFAKLDSGKVLLVSGEGAAGPVGAELFDPAAVSFSAARLVVNRAGAAVASRGREVLIAGGESAIGDEDTSEVYDDATGVSAQGQRLGSARRDASATVVGQEIVLIGGRRAGAAVAGVEKLAGTALGQVTVSALSDLADARYAHSATSVQGKVAVVGGFDPSGVALASIEWVDLTKKPAAPASTGPGITGPGLGGMTSPGSTAGGLTPSTPATPATPATPTTPAAGSGSGSGSGSSGGLGGFLSGLLGGSGSGSGSSSILTTVLNAAIQALTNNPGGGFSGFMQAFLSNLTQGLLGGGAGSGSGSGLSGVLSSLLGSLTSGSGSGSSSGGLSGLISSLLGSLGGSGSGSSSGSSSSSGLGGLLSSLLSGLTGGSSGSGSSASSGSSSSGLAGLLSSLFGGSGSGSGSSGAAAPAGPTVSSMTPGTGRAGDQVTIVGQNYGNNVLVRFNGVAAQILSAQRQANGDVTVVAVVPASATTGMVTVETGGTVANAGVFTVM